MNIPKEVSKLLDEREKFEDVAVYRSRRAKRGYGKHKQLLIDRLSRDDLMIGHLILLDTARTEYQHNLLIATINKAISSCKYLEEITHDNQKN